MQCSTRAELDALVHHVPTCHQGCPPCPTVIQFFPCPYESRAQGCGIRGWEHGSAQHTALVAVTSSVRAGQQTLILHQILILHLSTGPVARDPSALGGSK